MAPHPHPQHSARWLLHAGPPRGDLGRSARPDAPVHAASAGALRSVSPVRSLKPDEPPESWVTLALKQQPQTPPASEGPLTQTERCLPSFDQKAKSGADTLGNEEGHRGARGSTDRRQHTWARSQSALSSLGPSLGLQKGAGRGPSHL